MSDGNDKLQHLVRSLEKSIERAIASSPQVEECLARMRDEGYELSLVLQATLAFAPVGELDQREVEELAGIPHSSAAAGSPESSESEDAPRTAEGSGGKLQMSTLDKKFLRSLKIAIDEEQGTGS